MNEHLIHPPDGPIRDPGQKQGLADETLKRDQAQEPGQFDHYDGVFVRKVNGEACLRIEPPPHLRLGAEQKIEEGRGFLQKEVGYAGIVVVVIECIATAVIDHVDDADRRTACQFDQQTRDIIAITRIGFDIFDPPAVGDEKDNHQQQRWNDQVDNRQVLNHGLRI